MTRVAPHPDALVGLLVEQLATPPEDPFATELVAVPTRGIERWLTQRIASGLAAGGFGDGIAANIDFPSPARLVREVLLADPGLGPSVAAWEGPRLTGHVLDVIDAHLAEPWMRLINRYVASDDGGPSPNRWAAAAKIAALFSTYARRRPGMIRAWSAGGDTGPGDAPVPDADRWQPQLWRLVRERIGIPALAELLPGGLEAIRRGAVPLDLPDRLAVYGLTATDPLDLQVLAALGEQRDVHLYLLHPSPALWRAVAAGAHDEAMPIARGTDPTATLAEHPMLASWGSDSRELQLVLAAAGITAPAPAPSPAESAGSAEPAASTLLTRLQHDIRHNRQISRAADLAAAVSAGDDRSLQIHVCHGARRQAEVARDAILHVLAADPTLEPRDVVIMTPDLATFAPLLEAAFPRNGDHHGAANRSDGLPDLRLRIADRSPASTNPLVRFAAWVLDVAGGRMEASVVRDLVTRPVVQQRFGFDADTAGAIARVVADTNVSWGIDGAHRQAWGAGGNDARTWGRGLDQALTGVFYGDSPVRVVAGTAPLDGVEGQEASPVGYLAAIMDRLIAIRRTLAAPLPASQWGPAVAAAVRMLAAPAWGDEWQLGQLERLLGETFPPPDPNGSALGAPDPLLSLAEARRAIARWTDDRPSPLHFRTGDVTVCTLVPMRSVPYRVVCLVGMDDERFPRSSRLDGDDLLLGAEIVGDFDRSAQDRQLLLDAVMAAGDHLIVTYSGRDDLTNAELPPAVPVAELHDAVAAMVGEAALQRIVTAHPLQSFSAANFTPGALGVPGAFGFDPMQLAGADAVDGRGAAARLAPATWPQPDPTTTIKLTELVAFLQHPARRFMQVRMGLSIPAPGELPDDTLPAGLNALEVWGVKDRLVSGLAAGHDIATLMERERHSGALPPGALGTHDLENAVATAELLWAAAVDHGYDPEQLRPYHGAVAAGSATVEGTVLADPGRAHLAMVTPSTLRAKHRLEAFTRLVFLSVLAPAVEWRALLLGRRSGAKHLAITIGPLEGTPDERRTRAGELLAGLVDLYVEGHARPLPLPCESAYRWQRKVGSDRNKAWYELREVWETDRFSPERDDSAHAMLFPHLAATNDLLGSEFTDYCRRLWGPILAMSTEKSV